MHKSFPVNPLCAWRSFKFSAGMMDSTANNEKTNRGLTTECNTLNSYCWNANHIDFNKILRIIIIILKFFSYTVQFSDNISESHLFPYLSCLFMKLECHMTYGTCVSQMCFHMAGWGWRLEFNTHSHSTLTRLSVVLSQSPQILYTFIYKLDSVDICSNVKQTYW